MRRRKKFSLSRDFIQTIVHLSEKEVPYPWLYFAEVLPTDEYTRPSHPVNFCFRIDNRYAVTLQQQGEKVSPGQLNKWDYKFHYEPISNYKNLISIEQALACIWAKAIERKYFSEIEYYIAQYFGPIIEEEFKLSLEEALEHEFERTFDHLFSSYPIGPFHSCALYKPFSVEYREPFYFFRLHNSCHEILVGAISGEVRHRRNEERTSNGANQP